MAARRIDGNRGFRAVARRKPWGWVMYRRNVRTAYGAFYRPWDYYVHGQVAFMTG